MIGTILILFLYLVIILFGVTFVRDRDDANYFWGKEYTTVLRGICCILVMLVHIPAMYTNPLQKAIGGFSQVSVTLYFMFSAYGLIWSIRNKPDYLHGFWKNRVLILLIPFIVSCAIKRLFGFTPASGGAYFVFVLLFFYIVTYFFARYIPKYAGCIICVVILYSIIGRITENLAWSTQAMGFVYGILLAIYFEKVKKIIEKYYWILISVTLLLSMILIWLYIGTYNRLLIVDYLLQIFMVLSIIMFILVLTFKMKIGNKISYLLGIISYEIFLYHGLIQNALVKIDDLYLKETLSSGIFILLMFVTSILVAVIMHKLNNLVTTRIRSR